MGITNVVCKLSTVQREIFPGSYIFPLSPFYTRDLIYYCILLVSNDSLRNTMQKYR